MDKTVSYLKRLGLAHFRRDVKLSHYKQLGEALIKTIEDYYGPPMDQDIKTTWKGAFKMIQETMTKIDLTAGQEDVVEHYDNADVNV